MTIAAGRKPWLAAVLSLLCPGLGQVYCGRPVRGVVLFVLSLAYAPVVAVAASATPSDAMMYALIGSSVASLLVPLVAVLDAWLLARRLRAEFTPRAYQRPEAYAAFLLVGLALEIVVATAVTMRSFEAYKIASDSMAPTLVHGDRILANKVRFDRDAVRRGDIVVFRAPDRDAVYVKRVVGLPGDRVEVRDGHVFLNGAVLPADAPAGGADDGVRVEHNGARSYRVRMRDLAPDAKPAREVVVPEASFFVLGDGRDTSMDSRTIGPVPRGDVIGRAEYVYFADTGLGRAGALTDER